MEGWLQRVIEEKEELDKKISKLTEFINTPDKFTNLSILDKILIVRQQAVMREYSFILGDRIKMKDNTE